MTTTLTSVQKGGAWLFEDPHRETVFTPANMTEEHRLIDQTALEFVTNEVVDNIDQLETKDWVLARKLLRRAGELGLLGTDVPDAYGGVQLDKVSSAIIASRLGEAASFSTAFGAQTSPGLAQKPLHSGGDPAKLHGLKSGPAWKLL